MKKTRHKLYVIATLLLLNININAFDFEVDGINYNILSETDKTCEVTSGSSSDAYTGTVVIPEIVNHNNTDYTVIAIGDYAFQNYATITSVTIPNSITDIGQGAFRNCSAIKSLTIPNSVTTIEKYAFVNCSALTEINVENGNKNYSSQDGVLFNYDKTTLVQYPGGKNGEYVIPNLVTTIGSWAFSDCSSLTGITIPNTVTTIEKYAFRYCSALTELIIPNLVATIGNNAFEHCSSLTGITIPNLVTIINEGVFSGCSDLTSIKIPSSITTIGNYAFSDCSSLTSITIPKSVTAIGEEVFTGCSKLTEINVEEGNNYYCSFESILFNYDKTRLIQCPQKKNGEFIIPSTVKNIGNYAFEHCSSLTNVKIPDSVTTIGDYAFSNCKSLTNINIPNSVTIIGAYAFERCSSLANINISNSVTTIGEWTFSYCSDITEITIPNSVTTIGKYAFSRCTDLNNVTIGNSVTTIESRAFSNCKSIKEIHSLATTPPNCNNKTFEENIYSAASLYVPTGSLAAYLSTDVWKEFLNTKEFDPAGINNVTIDEGNGGKIIYDLNGHRLSTPQRGINIINGKKVIIK